MICARDRHLWPTAGGKHRGGSNRMFGVFEFSLRCNGLKPSRAKLRAACVTAVRVHARLVFVARAYVARTCARVSACFVHQPTGCSVPKLYFQNVWFEKEIALTRSTGKVFVFCKPRCIFNKFLGILRRCSMYN